MRVVYFLGTDPLIAPLGRAVLSIGAFDGVHMEHRRLFERASAVAAEEDARAVAVVLWPDPQAVADPEAAAAPRLLTLLDERLALLDGLMLLDAAIVIPCSEDRAAGAPAAALDALAAICQPVALIQGIDFALGDDDSTGLRVEMFGAAETDTSVASIQTALREGSLDAVTRLLGRAYTLGGEVVAGDRRGRTVGFPTANLRLDARKVLPAHGVYAVRVGLPGETATMHPAVCNIGVRPTFGGEPRLLVEVHLLDTSINLYGLTMRVDLIARLRDERRFNGIDELKAQIARDASAARLLLARPSERAASMSA